MDVRTKTVTELLTEKTDPQSVWDAYATAAHGEPYHAFLSLTEETPPFDGPWACAPIAVKDMFCTPELPTTAASRVLETYVPPYRATAVELVQARGVPLLGKTNMDEFAMGGANEYSAFGPSHNPWDIARVTGGSSGGSAAAVAGGLAPWALGSDTGGSVRQPASFCGVVGVKPSYGAISRFGMIAFASSLDQCGVFTRSVADARLLLSALTVADDRDMTATGVRIAEREDHAHSGDIRIGIVRSWINGASDAVRESINATLDTLVTHGATLVDIELPHVDSAIAAYYIIACVEASSNLARYDGVRFGSLTEPVTTMDDMYAHVRGRFGNEVARRIMLGTYALSEGHIDAYYTQAARARAWIADDFHKAFANIDCLMSPVAPTTAYLHGTVSEDPLEMYLGDVYTIPPSLAGLPALSVPVGLADGLPVGMHVVGARGTDDQLLSIAAHIERVAGRMTLPWERVS